MISRNLTLWFYLRQSQHSQCRKYIGGRVENTELVGEAALSFIATTLRYKADKTLYLNIHNIDSYTCARNIACAQ